MLLNAHKQFVATMAGVVRRAANAAGVRAAVRQGSAADAVAPILALQLEAASRDMETEVAKVCGNFQGMAHKAADSIRDSARLLQAQGGEKGIAVVIGECRQMLTTLLDQMQRGEELSNAAARRMEQVEASVERVSRVLAELDRSAFSNKLVALNAKVEAVHLGAAGRGFEVVAEEISTQAAHSTELTSKVGEILNELVSGAREAVGDLRRLASADHECIVNSRQGVTELLASMEKTTGEMRAMLQTSTERSRELTAEIEQALITLQFGDRVSQRIQHVVNALTEAHDRGASEGAEARGNASAARLAASYTMNSEREIHSAGTDNRPSRSAEAEIELF